MSTGPSPRCSIRSDAPFPSRLEKDITYAGINGFTVDNAVRAPLNVSCAARSRTFTTGAQGAQEVKLS